MASSILSSFSSSSCASSVFRRQFAHVWLLLIIAAVALGARDDPDEDKLVRDDPTKSVAMLNRYTFHTAVEQEHVDDWVVLFCVDWLPVCQGLWHHYKKAAVHWEGALSSSASSWQSSAVRFAEVDCATDKPLCNENSVESYPTILHLKGGKLVKKWEIYEYMFSEGIASAAKHLVSWISKELHGKLADGISSEAKTYAEVGLGYCLDAGEKFPEFYDRQGITLASCRKQCNSDSLCVGYDFRPSDGNCNVYAPSYSGSPPSTWLHNDGASGYTGPLADSDRSSPFTTCYSVKGQAAKKQDLSIASHLQELPKLLSWNALQADPATAALGYFTLAVAVGVIGWIVGTGLEFEVKAMFSRFGNDKANGKSWTSALLPHLPEMPASRTIVRKTFEL